ncbi:hypothetical protein GQ53DRAFT_58082 [Thozetella sp. PMI_491]|nr:hypothetical protein GQ53DRAFT_58082 [Thozetella sp. PMI_491]
MQYYGAAEGGGGGGQRARLGHAYMAAVGASSRSPRPLTSKHGVRDGMAEEIKLRRSLFWIELRGRCEARAKKSTECTELLLPYWRSTSYRNTCPSLSSLWPVYFIIT